MGGKTGNLVITVPDGENEGEDECNFKNNLLKIKTNDASGKEHRGEAKEVGAEGGEGGWWRGRRKRRWVQEEKVAAGGGGGG